ncbi:GntR family transcriptional regulator YhfZ [Clostridiaceae bacterium M8S5]|nr:GntR family transcriptional regulator YhfZ [Clostridiaceae bacterium M8S5]
MENIKKELMSKNGKTTVMLARELLTHNVGDRIKTIGQFAKDFGFGRGTVQAAFKYLQDSGAVKLESRGHLGTSITKMDNHKLWNISGFGIIMGVMPLPYSTRYEGLATGFYKEFEKCNIPFSLAFMRGANKRIEALNLGKYNFAIVSKLAANLEKRSTDSIEIIHEFGLESYVGNHVIIYKDDAYNQITHGMRVAIDPTSPDLIILTTYECEGLDVEYIETPYNQIIQRLENNEIDAAIWNIDEILEKNLKYKTSSLRNPKTKKVDSEDTIATVVVNKDNLQFGNILNKFINMDKIEEIQRDVMNKKTIPIY